ncbi:MAG: hypothetical protein GX234_11370 [Clostridiales bacterium]|nr:hypothetical protein [Clostridiales bacterium]
MEEQMEREIAGYDVTEIENFVVKRSDQYLERFERLAQNRRPKFNWAAAFLEFIGWAIEKYGGRELYIMHAILYSNCFLVRLLFI